MKERNVAAKSARITVTRLGGAWSKSMTGYNRNVKVWCAAALKGKKGNVSVVLADDATLKDLNHMFRGKNKATNVLSFEGEGDELGDIILAYETVKREAREQKKTFLRHTAHLIVHGCLHLLGHDHEIDAQAKKMEALEKTILGRLGFPDPYMVQA